MTHLERTAANQQPTMASQSVVSCTMYKSPLFLVPPVECALRHHRIFLCTTLFRICKFTEGIVEFHYTLAGVERPQTTAVNWVKAIHLIDTHKLYRTSSRQLLHWFLTGCHRWKSKYFSNNFLFSIRANSESLSLCLYLAIIVTFTWKLTRWLQLLLLLKMFLRITA